jgi:hypothetical protein
MMTMRLLGFLFLLVPFKSAATHNLEGDDDLLDHVELIPIISGLWIPLLSHHGKVSPPQWVEEEDPQQTQ